MTQPAQLGPAEAHEAIQTLLSKVGGIGLTRHAKERCAERNITIDDLFCVLEKGTVSPVAEWDDKSKSWRYVVTGVDCDRQPLKVVVVIDLGWERLTVVTTY